MRMRRGPGLVRTVGRTAVIAGTATAVSNRVSTRQATRAQEKAQAAAYQEQAAAPAPPPAAPAPPAPPAAGGGEEDLVAKLKELADLKAAGVLSDDEFAAAKAKLLS